MDTHQLMQFESVARNKSMTTAARELGVSQPSVSQAVKKLERELGVQLFSRNGADLELTQYGKILSHQAKVAFRSMSNAKAEITDSKDPKTKRIRLIARQPMGDMAQLLGKFNASYPLAQVVCLIPNEHTLAADYDVEIFASSSSLEDTNIIHVCDEKYSLCVPMGHKLAKKRSVELRSLRNEKFLLSPALSEMNNVIRGMFEEAGFSPKTPMYVSTYWDLIKLVEQGFGICISTDVSWLIENDANIATIPISDVKRIRSRPGRSRPGAGQA